MKSSKKRQVVIAGAGLIGSTMALALASQGFDVTVFDATTEEDRIKEIRDGLMLYLELQRIFSLILVCGMKKN